MIKIDENIAGIPNEVFVKFIVTKVGFYIRKGDKIQVFGNIYQELNKYWGKDFYWIDAIHIYNETLDCCY